MEDMDHQFVTIGANDPYQWARLQSPFYPSCPVFPAPSACSFLALERTDVKKCLFFSQPLPSSPASCILLLLCRTWLHEGLQPAGLMDWQTMLAKSFFNGNAMCSVGV